jgi:hypothetical protein
LPLETLSDADVTLADGYGHVADRAILLDAMLSAVGLRPQFVMASELPPIKPFTKIVESFPMPEQFFYPLVQVKVEGQTYYLNDTDQYARLGTTAHANRLGYALDRDALTEIKPAKDCAKMAETDYTVTLSDDGRAQIGITRYYYGSDYNGRKRYFAELPPEERRRYFQEIVSGVAQGARPVGDLITRFDSYPGLEQFTVTVDKYAVMDGKYFYFSLPFTPSLLPLAEDTRTLPMFIGVNRHGIIKTKIHLPPQFSKIVIAPTDKKLRADGAGTAKVKTGSKPGEFDISQDLEISPAMVSPQDYPALLKAEATLRAKSGRTFLLQKN